MWRTRAQLGALSVVHPFPSALNGLVVLALALLAGAAIPAASGLAVAMLALHFSIGAFNDVCDSDLDARTKPGKPIPAGLIRPHSALVVAVVSGGAGLAVSALYGPVVLLLAALTLGAGLAYDAVLKGGPWSWVAYAVALPVLPVFAWWGATGALPPRPELLLPLAAMAGPALQLANGSVDVERDLSAGVVTLAGRLGRRRSLTAMAVLQAVIHGLAWLTLIGSPTPAGAWLIPLTAAGGLVVVGLRLSASRSERLRERGWRAQAIALALLAAGWLAASVGAS